MAFSFQRENNALPFGEHGLRQVHQEPHEVAHAVAGVGAGGDHGHVGLGVGVLVEQGRVETLLSDGSHNLKRRTG